MEASARRRLRRTAVRGSRMLFAFGRRSRERERDSSGERVKVISKWNDGPGLAPAEGSYAAIKSVTGLSVPRRHVLSPIAVSVGAYRRDLPAREGKMKGDPGMREREKGAHRLSTSRRNSSSLAGFTVEAEQSGEGGAPTRVRASAAKARLTLINEIVARARGGRCRTRSRPAARQLFTLICFARFCSPSSRRPISSLPPRLVFSASIQTLVAR